MELLGIYQFSRVKKQTRTWEGIKELFELKKIELAYMVNQDAVSSEEKIIQKCAKILENTDRQVNQIVFFRDPLGPPTAASKIKCTEAHVDTISDKQVISQ